VILNLYQIKVFSEDTLVNKVKQLSD